VPSSKSIFLKGVAIGGHKVAMNEKRLPDLSQKIIIRSWSLSYSFVKQILQSGQVDACRTAEPDVKITSSSILISQFSAKLILIE